MKKIKLLLLGCLFALLLIPSCTINEEPSEQQNNPVSNTKWAAMYKEYTLWIEFTSNSAFLEFMGDANGNPASTGVHYGTYSYANGKITFLTHDSTSAFDYATVNGSMLELVYKSGSKRTFAKK